MSVRYGSWAGGPDPLEPPFDVAEALEELGDRVLAGEEPADALSSLQRRGAPGLRGLNDLLREVRRRRKALRNRGQLDGTLSEIRALLDNAIGYERAALAADPSDAARLAEAELDDVSSDTARAVRQLSEHEWRSAEAAAAYEQIRDLLRREVLDSQFRGMKQALSDADPAAMERVKDMLADLNAMLDADGRGEDTTAAFEQFRTKHGDLFPDNPQNLDELVDSLARRAAAASRMMASLTPEQREELSSLMAAAMGDLGLEMELDRLARALQWRRPDLGWDEQASLGGGRQLGLGDATTALEELADLEALEAGLGQDYPGASLDDIDIGALERSLGRSAVQDLEALREMERELERQGYLVREQGALKLTPKAVRRIGAAALRRIFDQLDALGRGEHETTGAGTLGEPTGATRAWRFGDEQPIDVVRTVRNAVLRGGGAGRRVRLAVEDFEVVETERRTSAAVSLLVDLSYSMVLRGAWEAAKSTALALHTLVTTSFPQDRVQLVGFSDTARELKPADLVSLAPEMVQGTNLQHALMLAGRHLARHPDAEPIVLVVTDGEPTAHLEPGGYPFFHWPPLRETLELTLGEVQRLTRRGVAINVFMLDDEPRLVAFVELMARLNGGRVFSPANDRLGDYVVSDYLRARRGRRAAAR